jgi:molybdenum cofactor cytidylyltransferase
MNRSFVPFVFLPSSNTMIAAIVLAAGKSERMGRPKALLPIRGTTFLENILSAISRSSIQHSVVVVGHHRDEIVERLGLPNIVFNPDYEQGMVTSFQAGIRALPPDVSGAVLFLVDHPLVEPSTIDSLIAGFAPGRIVLPVFEGRRGHPVLFADEVLQEILALPASQGANIVVRKDAGRIFEVSVNASGILVDIDTPEQFEKLQSDEASGDRR